MDKNKFNRRVGKNIKYIRKAQGIKQSDLANGVGVIVSTISKIERGLYAPPLQMFYDICGFIGASPSQILYRDAEYREWKEENPLFTDYSVAELVETLNISEDMWAQAQLCRMKNDKKGEEFYLDSIIQMCLRGSGYDFYREKMIPNLITCKNVNDAFRELADTVYKDWLNQHLDKIIAELRSNKINNLLLTEKKANNQEDL